MTNLAEVFGETEETEVETEVTVDEQTEVESEEDSTVEDDATTTVAEQDEAEPQSEKSGWEFQAYQDEKQKRQNLEKRLEELEGRLAQKKEEPEDDTDYISQSELKTRMESFATQQVQQALFQDRLTRHYDETKSKYEDFSEMETAFAQMAKADPNLRAQFVKAPNPAEFAYVQAKNAQLLSKYNGNIQAMLDAVRKEQGIESKEVKEAPAKKPKAPSLANATESEKNSAPVVKSTTLDDIFSDWNL